MKSKFFHSSWYDDYAPNRVNPVMTIYTGDEALFRFTIMSPQTPGLYWEKFQIFTGSNPIPGGEIDVAIKVVASETAMPISTPEPTITEPTTTPITEPAPKPISEEIWWQNIPSELSIVYQPRWTDLPNGPEIKVGLLYADTSDKDKYLPFKISTANNQSYDIYDQNDNLLIRNTAGEIIQIDYNYDTNRYIINDSQGKRILMTDSFLKLKNSNSTIFKINSWNNGPFWGQQVNDNEYRGSLEVHYNSSTGRLWLINQLPLEDYVKSIAEVGDGSYSEFLKAQMIAARTYAFFRYLTPKYTNTSDGESFFTVLATQADQVYRGYQRELRALNTVAAAEDTKGIVATYQNDPILAYYFAQSDGQTRDSYSARMTKAPVDYLIAKSDPPCEGKELLGHGVGLSQVGGINAAKQGANFAQILKYYYTGISLTKVY
jgi:hypothetical protein